MTYRMLQHMPDTALVHLQVAIQRRSDGNEFEEDHLWDYTSAKLIDKRGNAEHSGHFTPIATMNNLKNILEYLWHDAVVGLRPRRQTSDATRAC